MKQSPLWIRGGIVALVLLGPATAEPAVKDVSSVSLSSAAQEIASGAARTSRPESVLASMAPIAAAEAPAPAPADPFPARTYGNYDARRCIDELDRRAIPYERYGHARGVSTPVRLMGPLHGVLFLHNDSTSWLASARREVLDCRLVLALDDLTAVLASHGVAEVIHYGIYRGDVPLPTHGRPSHHVAGLAIDVAAFVKTDDTRLEVRRDWSGRVGAHTCVEGAAPKTSNSVSIELSGILCDLVKEKIFHQVLTPNHDSRHRDHFHLEVMRDTSWTMIE